MRSRYGLPTLLWTFMDSSDPIISVVIPTRNRTGMLREAVESVRRDAGGIAHEVVVVDDASDESAANRVLEELALGGVRVVRSSARKGAQGARHAGIVASRGKFIMTLDSDDIIRAPLNDELGYLETAVKRLDASPTYAFVHTGSCMFGEVQGSTISSYPLTEELVARKHHVPTGIVFRRSDVKLGATHDPVVTKWQDWSFGVDILAVRRERGLSNGIGFVPGNRYGYRVHALDRRISAACVDELAMVRRTVERRPAFFRYWHADIADDDLPQRVLSCKPSRLDDLLRVAAYDLPMALQMAHERRAQMVSALDSRDVP
jgi:glycosyltransferase involved in cell wall biosynthesis